MTKTPVCAQEDEEIDSVIAKMTEKNIIRLPIVGEDASLLASLLGRISSAA